jgi:hypothetical protein
LRADVRRVHVQHSAEPEVCQPARHDTRPCLAKGQLACMSHEQTPGLTFLQHIVETVFPPSTESRAYYRHVTHAQGAEMPQTQYRTCR